MIEFDCPHCGNHLTQQETYAGRDGWCRICKGIILIPRPGQTASELKLSLEQRYERLDRLFKHAVTIVDEYRQLQSRLQGGQIDKAGEVAQRAAKDQSAQLEKLSAQYSSAQEECDQLRGRISALDVEAADRTKLEDTLAVLQLLAERVPDLESTLSDARKEVNRRERENDELLERVLDLEQKLDTAAEMAAKAVDERTTERDTYEKRLDGLRDELCGAEEDGAALQERLDAAVDVESQLQSELVTANTLMAEASGQLAEALLLADRIPVLEEEIATARTEIQAGEDRRQVFVRQAADSECALELAEKRASDARGAWETQRQQLLDETEALRAGQRAAEEETAFVRGRGREAAAELRSQLDTIQGDLLNETRLRVVSEESEQRQQRRTNEANAERDDVLSRRDQLSRQLETALEDLESARGEITSARASALESETAEQSLRLRLTSAYSERDHSLESREQLAVQLDDVSGKHESAQRVCVQLRTQIAELEHTITAFDEGRAVAIGQQDLELETLHAEVIRLSAKVADLENALGASNREKTRLEQRLVGAAFSELEGAGYRSKFSTMAKQFYEQEVARLTDAQGVPEFDDANNGATLDAVSHLRR